LIGICPNFTFSGTVQFGKKNFNVGMKFATSLGQNFTLGSKIAMKKRRLVPVGLTKRWTLLWGAVGIWQGTVKSEC